MNELRRKKKKSRLIFFFWIDRLRSFILMHGHADEILLLDMARAFREKVIISGIDDAGGWAWIPVSTGGFDDPRKQMASFSSRGKKVLLLSASFFFSLHRFRATTQRSILEREISRIKRITRLRQFLRNGGRPCRLGDAPGVRLIENGVDVIVTVAGGGFHLTLFSEWRKRRFPDVS